MSTAAHTFVVPSDHPALDGHFPGRPVVPGVVALAEIVEALAAAGVPRAPLALRRVKFLAPVPPGEPVTVELEPGMAGTIGFACRAGGRRLITGIAESAPAAAAGDAP